MYIHNDTHLLTLLTLLFNLRYLHYSRYSRYSSSAYSTYQYLGWRQPDLPSEESDAIAYVLHMAVVAVVQHLIKAVHRLYASARHHQCLSKKKGVCF